MEYDLKNILSNSTYIQQYIHQFDMIAQQASPGEPELGNSLLRIWLRKQSVGPLVHQVSNSKLTIIISLLILGDKEKLSPKIIYMDLAFLFLLISISILLFET